jgi:FtsH-binding integral membrane protein
VRWKLIIITSLLAALAGIGVTLVTLASLMNVSMREPYFTLLTSEFSPLLYIMPLAAIGSVFVYRHTPRRRKIQAALTILLSLVFASALYACAVFFRVA